MEYIPTKINSTLLEHMTIETPGLCVHFGFEGVETGIVPTIRTLGGFLFYGAMSPDKFLEIYRHNWVSHLNYLNQADTLDHDLKKRIGFYLAMCRVSMKEDWKYPALISRDVDGSLDQETGLSRAFATMITKVNPWNHYNVIMLERSFHAPDFFDNPIRVETDHDLHKILKTKFEPGFNQQHLYFNIWNRNNSPYLRLNYVGNGTMHDQNPIEAQVLLEKFLKWKSKFPNPKIKIYTAWPEQIKNTGNFWDVEIAGSTQELYQETQGRPAYLDTVIRHFHDHDRESLGDSHALWIVNPRPFDIANFLPWMNMDANVLHDNNYDFLMYRADQDYVSQEIAVYSHNL